MKIRSRLLTRLIAWIAAKLSRLLFSTCKIVLHAEVPNTIPYEGTGSNRYLYCVWHDQLMMIIFSGRPQNASGLVSRHQDGSYLADAMEILGITPVRGSTKRGGSRAMRELIQQTKELHITITPDGPRGPRRELKTGIVFLASHSGRAIIPTAFSCRRCWRMQGSWTDMLIPKPFTTVYGRSGPLLHIPSGLNRAELNVYTEKLQAAMEQIQADVDALARGDVAPPSQPELKSAA